MIKRSIKSGDIVLIPFPFTDLTSNKVRPALILSNEDKKDIIVCCISSNISQAKYKNNITVSKSECEDLKIDSVLLIDKIATLDKDIIIGNIGHLSEKIKEKVRINIKNIFRNF